MPRMRSLALLLLVALATPAGAAELYRCTVKGRTIYQDAPCKEGGRKIDTDAREAIRGYGTRPDEGAAPAAAAPATAAPVAAPSAATAATPAAAAPAAAGKAAADECAGLAARVGDLRKQVKTATTQAEQTQLVDALRKAEAQMATRKCGT